MVKPIEKMKDLAGVDRTAIVLLCLDVERSARMISGFDEKEVRQVTAAMAGLNMVTAEVVEEVLSEFLSAMTDGAGLSGDSLATREILARAFNEDLANAIMAEVRGPVRGKGTWEQFANSNENVIAGYLRNEYPQTAAVILTKVPVTVAAKVLPLLPDAHRLDIIERMIVMDSISRDALESIEEVIRRDFIHTASRASNLDPHQRMADIFNLFDQEQFKHVSERLESSMNDTFVRIKSKMFTFDDLVRLSQQDLGRVMRAANTRRLAQALKAAKPELRPQFLEALGERSRGLLQEEMANLGPTRMKEAQEAQAELVQIAKDMADQEQIKLPSPDEDEEII